MRHFGTAYRFRQTAADEAGRRWVVWASDGPGRGLEFPLGEVPAGDPELAHGQLWTPNEVADEGALDMLDVYFDAQAVRSTLYGRLYNDTPVDTDTLATLSNEVSGSGYGAVTITRGTDWAAPALDGGVPAVALGSAKTFTATGAWTAATYFVLATVASGTSGLLVAFAALSATRTLADTETLDVDAKVTLD